MEEFKLKATEEFIELNNLIKILGWVPTGGEAKNAIKEGLLKVNNEVELQVRKKLRAGDVIKFETNSCKIIQNK